jgi:ABC-type multidrug transport system fused ATPase/permease subunit
MIEIPYLKEFFKSIQRTTIDDFADRLFYYYTALMLTFFAILTGAKQTIGKPIECMMPAEFPNTWSDYVRGFCYVSSTYFVPVNDTSSIEYKQEKMVHGYYQWVPFILIIQALLIYLPNLAWKTFQKTQRIDFQHVVEKAKTLRFEMGDEHQKSIKDVVAYLKQRLQHQGTSHGYSYVGFGMKSALAHIFAKMLTILVILFEISFINTNFGPAPDNFWGLTMFHQGLTNSRWNESGVFPRVTFCDFKQPTFGGKPPQRTVQCVLMVNMLNEKIFIFVWLWLAVCLIISIIDLIYTVVTLFTPYLRRKAVRNYVQALNHSSANSITTTSSSTVSMSDDYKLIDFAAHILGADGVHMFQFINFHAGPLIANEIGSALFTSIYNEDAPTRPPSRFEPPRFDNTTLVFGEDQGKSHC